MSSNRIRGLSDVWACSHERLRATDYDETYHWVVECSDCGYLGSMTQAEWSAWARAHVPAVAPATLVVGDGAESGRVHLRRAAE